MLKSGVIHPAQGVLKVTNHPMSDTRHKHLNKMSPTAKKNNYMTPIQRSGYLHQS